MQLFRKLLKVAQRRGGCVKRARGATGSEAGTPSQ